MLSFRLFGYPVRIEWMFWVLCVLLGMPYLQKQGPEALGQFLIVTAVVLGSILWHELGHAWARRRCGEPYSEITLYGFGGLCGGPGRFTRHESMFISAAGPAASLLLGGAVWLLVLTPIAANPWLRFFAGWMHWVNVGWAILNLLPVLPLDGGRIFEAALANRNPGLVPRVGFGVALGVAILGLLSAQFFLAVVFGMLAHGNYRRMRGGFF
jgi:stage IV sporulation protein FB